MTKHTNVDDSTLLERLKMRIHPLAFPTAFLLAALLWGGGTPAAAASQGTFTVNSTIDRPDALPGNGICETEPGNGVCTLRGAILEANAHLGADTIFLPAGTFVLILAGQDSTGLIGDLDILDDLVINGTGAASTVIDGNGAVTLDRVIQIPPAVTVSIFNLTIKRGAGSSGGGISNSGALSLTNSSMSGNPAESQGGGISNSGTLVVTNSTLSGNHSKTGGGIYNTGTLLLGNTTVQGNSSLESGGGIYTAHSMLRILNSTISGNSADAWGGGILADDATIHLYNVTLVSNVADDDNDDAAEGGGIFNYDSAISLQNTIIANNVHRSTQIPIPLADDCKGVLTSEDYNLIENLTGCAVTHLTAHNITGQDPELDPLQNNGGTTLTHALKLNSPAIDSGDTTGCENQNGGYLTTDQRGAPRPVDGDQNRSAICDIGAFEYTGGTTNPSPTSTKTATSPPATATKTPTNPPPTATKTPTNPPPATATHTPTSSNGCATKPNKPQLVAPQNNKTVPKVKVKLDWKDVPCATEYKVKVSQGAKNGPVADKKTVTASIYKTEILQIGEVYFWFVKACNDHGCAKSETRKFTIPTKIEEH
jgi:CSLREA domain-containing protein